MSKKNSLPGSFFGYQAISEIHGRVLKVITEERRASPSAFFKKGFSLILVDEGSGKEDCVSERVKVVISNNDEISPEMITGENSIEGKMVTIESNRIIIVG
jgi:hypothetical protein